MHFSQFSSENIREFSQTFPVHCLFRLNAQNLNVAFVKPFENMVKHAFLAIFLTKFLTFF